MADINLLRSKTKQLCLKFIEECKKQGILVSIVQTLRTMETQTAYYAQGRNNLEEVNRLRKIANLYLITEKENTKVTNAKAGLSPHNYGLAFDFAPIVNGKVDWNAISLFKKCGAIAKTLNVEGYVLEWGGDFKSLVDYPHLQMKNWKNYK